MCFSINMSFRNTYGFLIGTLLFLCSMPAFAQTQSLKKTEASLKKLHGLDKLHTLNFLTNYYLDDDVKKAIKYGKQAVLLGENLFDEANKSIDRSEQVELVQAYAQYGFALYDREKYFDAQEQLYKARTLGEQLGETTYTNEVATYLANIQEMIDAGELKEGFLSKTLGDLKVGDAINKASKDIKIQSEITLAKSSEKKQNYINAIDHYKKAVLLLKETGDYERVSSINLTIAALYDSLNQYSEKQKFLDDEIAEIEANYDQVINKINPKLNTGHQDVSIDSIITSNSHLIKDRRIKLKNLSEEYARKKNYTKSLAYYKLYQELSKKIETDSLKAIIEARKRSNEIFLLKQQKEIANLNLKNIAIEKEKQVRLRNTTILVAVVIFLGTLGVLYFYFAKRKEHRKLTLAYKDLDQTKEKLEQAEKRIVKLLSQQVSGDIALELIASGPNKPATRNFVCVMFLDIRGFTPIAEKMTPEELIVYQNSVFGFMIDIVEKFHGNINQLLGDGFMATFGAPVSGGNDCQNAFFAAKEILQEVNRKSEVGTIRKTRIGIGLHAGNVVTGNVGNEKRKQYSVTGNPVIIASRVEQLNKTYNSQMIITEEVYNELTPNTISDFTFIEVNVKGRSEPVNIITVA